MALVSIIVPVYNSEKYLRKCIDGIIAQTLKDIEIILVDDGSTDDSGKICDEYVSRDTRIKVLHTKNFGITHARDMGLIESTGKYIGFVDSDDWIDPEMYESLYNLIIKTNADMAINSFFLEYESGRHLKRDFHFFSKEIILSAEDTAKRFVKNSTFGAYAWNKLYKREILKDNPNSKKYPLYEDNVFFVNALINCHSVVYKKDAYYHYYQRNNSIIHQNSTVFEYMLPAIEDSAKILYSEFPDIKNLIYEWKVFWYINIAKELACLNRLDDKKYAVLSKKIEFDLNNIKKHRCIYRKAKKFLNMRKK